MFGLLLRSRFSSTALRSSRNAAHTQPPRASRSFIRPTLFTAAAGLSGYALGSFYPPDALTFISPRVAPPPPPPGHPDAVLLVQAIEDQLHSLSLIKSLRSAPDADDWYETRPYANIQEERRVNHLTTGALRGLGRLAVAPLVRARKDETASVVFIHVGRGLCGHDGIIHGGLLATLLDETLARTAILNLPESVGVTANLSLNYRAPTKADQFIVIKTKLEEKKGRKAKVTGVVEDLNGTVLVEASGTFVQPRYAKLLNSAAVREAIGAPPAPIQPRLAAETEMAPEDTAKSTASRV